ncbi:oligosaccharide flippase family protein [Sphingomonas sp. IC-11]|uniref:lipopolysaccharide biosynthesis protein n=1 Tax=Sphingomonas sp. IC-11 TaxID=2898528 RepID=UPI001E519F46|nr:oligosaccharide flippase family protein [Sphingomonas sp. IC-11]MCD2317027.1 oligosaccharide flippase family protein [Sphingomonas sp. IC-11]
MALLRLRMNRPHDRQSLRRRLIRNLSHLAAGKAASTAVGLVTLALTARLLGPASFGIVAVIESYCRLIDQVLRLETWQAIIRYGTGALLAEDKVQLASLIKLGIVVDVAGALLVTTVAVGAAPLASEMLGWSHEAQRLAQLYALSLLFGVSSTPVGILRLFGKFAQAAWIDPSLAVLRLAGVIIITVTGGSLKAVVGLLISLVIAERVITTALAWRTLRAEGIAAVGTASLSGWNRRFPQFASFLWSANVSVLLRKATQETDTLAVGFLLGSTSAGLYQFARRIMQTVSKTAQMLQQVVTPDLAKLWAELAKSRFLRLVRRVELATIGAAVAAFIVLTIAGPRIILLVGGPQFTGAYAPLLAYAVAIALFLAGTTMRSALMVSGHQHAVLKSAMAATIVYLAILVPNIKAFGVIGASIAQIAFSGVALAITLRSFRALVVRTQAVPQPCRG